MISPPSSPEHPIEQGQFNFDAYSSGYVSDSADSCSTGSNIDGIYSSQTSSSSSPSVVSVSSGISAFSGPRQPGYQKPAESVVSWLDAYRSEPCPQTTPAKLQTAAIATATATATLHATQRQNPRRTAQSAVSGDQQRTLPCSLRRQQSRTEGFVDLLVIFTADLVEAIWPLSAYPPRVDTRFYGGGVLPLKSFISETLRRSKTSYSTLQVALYYLIVLKGHLPEGDLTKEQPKGNDCRAMQCGRRMFLSALILASKYLQDRNYSSRAWSKISGLRSTEINQNEIKYLEAIGWKLHVPKETFDRWQNLVLRLSSAPPGVDTCSGVNMAQVIGWKSLITHITPELSENSLELQRLGPARPLSPPTDQWPTECESAQPRPDNNITATFTTSAEPTPRQANAVPPTLPPMPRLHNLPTPQTTPSSRFECMPTVSALKTYPRCHASYAAMSNVRRECLARATLDRCPPPQPQSGNHFNFFQQRRSSLSKSVASLTSSPESMMSDHSSVSTRSRSSSISSLASSGCGVAQITSFDLAAARKSSSNNCTTFNTPTRSSSGESQSLTIGNSTVDHIAPEWCASPLAEESHQTNGFYNVGRTFTENMGTKMSAPSRTQLLPSHDSSLSDLEAAATLCNLKPDMIKAMTPNITRTNLNANPKKSRGKVDISPSKAHKRSHSKANNALQDQVRIALREHVNRGDIASADGYVVSPGCPPVSHPHKASQSPSMSWFEVKTPVPVQGTENSKRLCASQNKVGAPQQAALLLRQEMQQNWVRCASGTY